MVESIYKDQLESVLYSVNQYATDFLTAQVDRLENDLNSTADSTVTGVLDGIEFFQVLDPENGYSLENPVSPFAEHFSSVIQSNEELVDQLFNYLENGYQKLQPTNMVVLEDQRFQTMLVALSIEKRPHILIAVIDPFAFTLDILQPKMQEVGQEEMIINLSIKETEEIIYSTEANENQSVLAISDVWLFPELQLGIAPKNLTLQNVVQVRLRNNLIALGLLVVLLVVGFILIFRNLNKEIHLAQAKSDFVSNVSHELRTPLSLISMFAESLVYGRVPKVKETQYQEIILKETTRLTNIVNRILNFSRIEANKRTYHFSQIELNELVKEVFADYSYHMEQHGFDYELNLADKEILIDIDRDAIYEAVVNLIDNAIKYSEDNKLVIIKTEENASTASIAVKDHGVGIAEDRQKQIFEKFFRVSKGDVYMAQGTGLGLTIISHIMNAHNGKIEVESKEGEGSTFILRFNK